MALNKRRVGAPPSNRNINNGPAPAQYFEDFYVYTAQFADLAPGDQGTFNIQIQADADFKWTKSTYQADIAAAAFTNSSQPVPNVTIQVTDSGTGKQLFQTPPPIATLFGTGQLPFILPIARVFSARSSMLVQVANYDAAVTYNLQLQFIGMKIWQQ